MELSLREDGAIHAQDAEFEKGHANAIEVFVDNIDLPMKGRLGSLTDLIFSKISCSSEAALADLQFEAFVHF